jgi:hypothetical protein
LKSTRSFTPILNVFQLMIAFWVDWLMVTEALPCPVIVAAPPTTVPPSGPAATRATPSASNAVAVRKRLRRRDRRGCIRKSRYSRAVRMKKNRSDAAARRSKVDEAKDAEQSSGEDGKGATRARA